MNISQFFQSGKRAFGLAALMSCSLVMSGCEINSNDDDGKEQKSTSSIMLYNASANSPTLELGINDKRKIKVDFGNASGAVSIEEKKANVAVEWETDSDDSESIFDHELELAKDHVYLLSVTGDIREPNVEVLNFPTESLDGKFQLYFLGTASKHSGLDVYMSKGNENFKDAEMVTSLAHNKLSKPVDKDIGEYKFYLTEAGKSEALFMSSVIRLKHANQYVITIEASQGPSESDYMMTKISKSATTEKILNEGNVTEYRVFNGLKAGDIDFYLDKVDDDAEFTNIKESAFSTMAEASTGDFSMSVLSSADSSDLVRNQILTLESNDSKSVFFYYDSEGNSRSITALNSKSQNLYRHQLQIVNLVSEYKLINVFFTRNNETIDSAKFKTSSSFASVEDVTLPNDIYDVYVTTDVNGTRLLLAKDQLEVNEEHRSLFMVIEELGNSEFKISFDE